MAILNNSNAISSGGYDINNSLRFRSSASAYLSRTPASTTNRQTWTWSGWVKRGTLGTLQNIFSAGTASTDRNLIRFIDGLDTLQIFLTRSGTTQYFLETTQVFRDPSSWYHIVITLDTTNATSTDRVRLYINGSRVTSFSSATYPSLSYAGGLINTTDPHTIARNPFIASEYLDGYLTDVNFIDGQQLTPSSFGETDTTTGSWKPKAYSGTFGTNGFYLKFSDIATTSGSNAGLGKDFSGNGNYWNTNNISVTAGTTYDAMSDVPTLTSATVANYATLNPLLRLNGIVGTFTNGNLNFLAPTAADYYYCSTMFTGTTGKYYSEATINAVGSGILIGLINEAQVGTAWGNKSAYRETGVIYDLSGTAVTSGSTFTTGDVIGIAVDIGAGTVQFYKNNVAQGATPSFSFTAGTPLAFAGRSNNGSADVAFNFGQRPFSYTPPTGFVRLNTFNLPDSTIKKGNTVMDATLYTGNSTTVTATNAGAFKPDLVWIKDRTSVASHVLTDSVRGTTKQLFSNLTNAEQTDSNYVTSFNSNGFTVGTGQSGTGVVNNPGDTFVGWQWQAGQGSTSSNTSGSITSTVSVNTTAGFSVVTWTGNGTIGATVGHGLGVAPSMIIVKQRSGTESWATYHISLGATKYLNLNQDIAAATSITRWNNTTPSSTVITFYNDDVTNRSGGTYVAYCWAAIPGYSAFGSYVGNGSADGTFVYTGFRPKYVLIKANAVYQWLVWDSVRTTYNIKGKYFLVDLSNAEDTFDAIDFVSNGFKIRVNHPAVNTSGTTYIYMAFAENPFKNANAA